MPKKSSKPKYPSYEDGELRDPKITELHKQVDGDQKGKLLRLIKKAVTAPNSSN